MPIRYSGRRRDTEEWGKAVTVEVVRAANEELAKNDAEKSVLWPDIRVFGSDRNASGTSEPQ